MLGKYSLNVSKMENEEPALSSHYTHIKMYVSMTSWFLRIDFKNYWGYISVLFQTTSSISFV